MKLIQLPIILPVLVILSCSVMHRDNNRSQYYSNPFVISLDIPAPEDDKGSVIVADLNNDGLRDYIVTVPGHIAAYDNRGRKLWIIRTDIRLSMDAEQFGLPGQHSPGVQAADVDEDGHIEVLFLTEDSTIHAVDGATAAEEWTATPSVPDGARQWEHLVVANFNGNGDTDILLQATNKRGYRTGRYLSAHRISDLQNSNMISWLAPTLPHEWQTLTGTERMKLLAALSSVTKGRCCINFHLPAILML